MSDKILPPNPLNAVRENTDKLGIVIFRSIISLMWLSQGFAKLIIRDKSNMYNDFNAFLGDLNYMQVTNPIPLVVSILNDFLIPNWKIVLVIVIFTELSIGISLGLGLFSRLGSFVGATMSLSLWIMTLGWDEWIWTYPLIFFPHVLFFLAGSGQFIGLDRWVHDKTENKIILLLT